MKKDETNNTRKISNKDKNMALSPIADRETIIDPISIINEEEISNAMPNLIGENQLQNLINSLNNLNISSLNGDSSLYSDINNKLDSINKLLSTHNDNSSNNTDNSSPTSVLDSLNSVLQHVTTINALKNQLNELPFNTFEKVYVENCITPALTVLYQLVISAASFKDTAQSLSLSTTTKRKTHKIKDYEKTTYEIMDQIQCIYDILEHRINDFIKILCQCK